jgi:hypothetical protein
VYIDKTNRHEFIGKTVDCLKRMHHYYPLTIQMRDNQFFYVDASGTWIVFNDKDTIYYDAIIEGREEG